MSQQSSGQAMLNNIREAILNTHHSVDLEFPGIPPDIGLFLTRSFAEDPDIERALPRYLPLARFCNYQKLVLTYRDLPGYPSIRRL